MLSQPDFHALLQDLAAAELACAAFNAQRTGTDNLPILNQVVAQQGGPAAPQQYTNTSIPSVWRTGRTQAAAKVEALSSNGMDEIEIPAFLRKQAD